MDGDGDDNCDGYIDSDNSNDGDGGDGGDVIGGDSGDCGDVVDTVQESLAVAPTGTLMFNWWCGTSTGGLERSTWVVTKFKFDPRGKILVGH